MASDARIQEIASEKESLHSQVNELREALSRETNRTDGRDRAQSEAKAFYDLILQKKRAEAVKRYSSLPIDRFSPVEAAVFRDANNEFRRDLAMETLRGGLDLMRTGRYAEAAAKFVRRCGIGTTRRMLRCFAFI